MELASGRRAIEPGEEGREMLICWVWELYSRGTIVEAADEKLEMTTKERDEVERMMMVGLWCAHQEASSRPSMRQVISALSFEVAVPDLKLSPSSIAPPPHMMMTTMSTGMSSSAMSSDERRSSSNDGRNYNNSRVNASTGFSR